MILNVKILGKKTSASSHSFFVGNSYLCLRSDFWALPSHCAIPWQELFESEEEAKSPTQWDSSLNEADEKELEALLVEAADKTQDENDMEALLLEAAAEDETENQEENNDEAIEALLLEAEKEAAEDEFLLKVYSQNLPF